MDESAAGETIPAPAGHVVVYLVMAVAIFRDGYEEVMRRLAGGLQFMRVWQIADRGFSASGSAGTAC